MLKPPKSRTLILGSPSLGLIRPACGLRSPRYKLQLRSLLTCRQAITLSDAIMLSDAIKLSSLSTVVVTSQSAVRQRVRQQVTTKRFLFITCSRLFCRKEGFYALLLSIQFSIWMSLMFLKSSTFSVTIIIFLATAVQPISRSNSPEGFGEKDVLLEKQVALSALSAPK